jgi:excisionase family DNA binding protein
VSERTIRSWIRSPVNPLPAVKVRGKVLVRKSDFDAFLQRFRIRPPEEIDIDSIVRDVLKGEGDGR